MAFALMASLLACPDAWAGSPTVETYVDQAVPMPPPPDAGYANGPLQAGQMTLEDVLEAHPTPKPAPPQIGSTTTAGTAASPPVMAPSTKASTEGSMLMQGMQSVLQKSGIEVTPLQAPQLPAGTAASNASFMAGVSSPSAASSGFQYQPGQAPKNLSSFTSTVPSGQPTSLMATAPEAASPSLPAEAPVALSPAPVSLSSSAPPSSAASASGACVPHTESWTRTCAEAGYPDSFAGQIKGETHIVCPGNTMQDVWISNTCAASEGTENNTPLSAPSPIEPPATVVASLSSSAPAVSASPDGNCGPANGLAASIKPMAGDLCISGEATEVIGDGPWRWNCKGTAGGMTVSCAAPVAATAPLPLSPARETGATATSEDGTCGVANGVTMDHAPASGLCAQGDASRVSGDGPWTWACSGRNGGQAAACAAPRKIDGACGGAVASGADEMPTADLCAAGYAGAVTGNGPWNWACSGLYGGVPALCSASPRRDAVCGGATISGHRESPQGDLCSIGQASNVNGGGPWTWTCSGINGGAAVSCTAPISVSGACGPANGVAATMAPSEELCTHGKATRVTGEGPWSWNCPGSDGGDTVSCTAPVERTPPVAAAPVAVPATSVAQEAAPVAPSVTANVSAFVGCGTAAEFAPFEAPSKDLCSKGHAGSITGEGPWSWSCSDGSGHSVNCSTLAPASFGAPRISAPPKASSEMPAPLAAPAAPVDMASVEKVSCGAAAGQGALAAPAEGSLCSGGKASLIHGQGPWSWTCAKGKEKVSCTAPKLQDAACGAANGSVQKSMPGTGLCNAGMATEIQGTGPWMWSCIGSGGGVSVSCSAASQAETRVDGACGAAASNPAPGRPAVNLCDSGLPSTVYGDGPWTWTCSGLNGGIASTCSAQKSAIAAPPPPGPTVNGLCGNANGVAAVAQPEEDLCSTGTATSVSGNGPWNWNCIGENGGMSVSCTAPLQPPAPITGVCGAASGVPTLTTPRSGLCAAGISSAVSGKGPWTWSCSGTNGGGAVGCVAPLAGAGGTAALPSLVTPSAEAPSPKPAPQTPVAVTGLVTPQLPAGPLPPLATGTMPQLVPSSPFPMPPEASALPPVPAPGELPEAPAIEPGLPSDTQALQPPPVRDTIKPSPALAPAGMDEQGKLIPGNHFVLPDDLSTISFSTGSENIDPKATPNLDKLAYLLKTGTGVRVTLTAYAGVGDSISPREARRLSLTRALAVRDYLTAKGVSSARIDVRALGANVPSGDPDRVDIKAN